ncbi:AI-2E family transporter [Corallococcus llansteffanensis]|uniref:AI-2E family transporter n=1 Tax=Corallococcus llansteffanensis TaxID=2316731 RepID=A0A3A8P8K5_9BACT|nr:AI-2E family transporter [Corallococcus llansteffanensis]RKH48134.1 AI-2E family transporter [Corallococcus llansteffanensis]
MKASRRGVPVYVPPRTVWSVGLQVVLLVLLGTALQRLGPVLTLLAVALLLGLAAEPVVRRLQAWGLRRGLGVALIALTLLGVTGLLILTLVPLLVEQLENLVRAAPGFFAELNQVPWLKKLDEHTGVLSHPRDAFNIEAGVLARPLITVLSSTLELMGAGVTVLALAVFGLLFGQDLYASILGWVRPRSRSRVRRVVGRMREAVGNYLVGTLLIVSVGGAFTALMSLALGVPYFLPLGLVAMVLGLIPYIGSVVTALLVSVTTLASVGSRRALIALALFMVYQQIESHLLSPLVQRRAIKMNPLLISLVALVGGSVAGLLGVILAVPAGAAGQVLVTEVQRERRKMWKRERRLATAAPSPHGNADEALLAGPLAPRGSDARRAPPTDSGHPGTPH